MLLLFGIVIILACVLLGFFVLVQNPKGGGLSGTFGGFGNQVMGVRQTTDVLEKGTWILAAIIAVLCLALLPLSAKAPLHRSPKPLWNRMRAVRYRRLPHRLPCPVQHRLLNSNRLLKRNNAVYLTIFRPRR
jgi:preprotein translocase subunit SecG